MLLISMVLMLALMLGLVVGIDDLLFHRLAPPSSTAAQRHGLHRLGLRGRLGRRWSGLVRS